MSINDRSKFCLSLLNGQCWQLTASEATSQWLNKLAHILSLEATGNSDCYKISFIKRGHNTVDYESYIPDDLPKKGWYIRKMRPARLLYHNEIPDIICDIGEPYGKYKQYPSMICSLTPIIEQAIRAGGAPFHSGLIVRDSYGILIMAMPRVGKSTCCKRMPAPWKAWCDDNMLMIRDDDGNYHGHPLPTWSDLFDDSKDITWDVQAHVPIRAIFLLEQSDRDEAIPISRVQAATAIYHSALRGCYYIIREEDCDVNAENRYLTFNNVCEIAKRIPTFKLRASLNGKFWEEVDRVLQSI